ncbi:hypothetical protein BGZ52_000385 [Haplosporangium bisporale]|nr:hypothetical protein BGZ52_000385 [Haplosporangium bisporale]
MVSTATLPGAPGIDSSEGHGPHHYDTITHARTDEPQSASLYDQHLVHHQQPQPQDNHLRPDSPASLEDSQSESGFDSRSIDTADTERSVQGLSDRSSKVMMDHNDDTENDAVSCNDEANEITPTPSTPLSKDENLTEHHGHEASSLFDSSVLLDKGEHGSEDLLTQEKKQGQEYLEMKSASISSEGDTTDLSVETANSTTTATTTEDSEREEEAMPGTPTPQRVAPVPKISAWSTLLPGVSPIPVTPPKPVVRSTARSTELRLHELLPIVLPHESEVKLTMEMVDLFEDLLPTEESHERRTKLIQKIEHILKTEWPGQDIQAHPFGSTVNDLGTSSSDVDICITTTWSGLKNVQMLANAFRKHGMQKVFCVPRAKVPIVKLWDPELFLSCDMNINTHLGLLNTRMIKTYVAIDPRVRPFAMIIKHWARRRVLNDAANGGTISTYTWICIVINFLQMRSPPILPALHKMPHTLAADNQVINGNNTSFCDDLSQLEGFGFANKETLGGLLYAFFRRFAIEFDYDNHVISVREGCYLTKESKGWHVPGKQYKMICVEEPFDTTRNLGNSSDMTSSKGLKEEFRRALDILYQKCSLDAVCAQYVFPPSYYNSNGYGNRNNKKTTTATDANGVVSQAQRENSYAGRRYINSYRNNNYYYDDQDYDDDDDDDEEPAPKEISVMETLNIGTRPSTSKNPISGNNESKSRESSTGGSRSAQSKEASSSSGSKGDQSNRSQSRNRSRQKEGTTESSSSTTAKGSSRSSSSKEKSGSTGSSSSSARNRKKGSGGGGGDGQKGGRSGGNSSNGSGRAARSTVEFSLAEIANVAPKLLSAAKKEQQQLLQQQQQQQQQHHHHHHQQQQQGSNQDSSQANGDTSGSGAGEEGSSTGSSSKGRRKGRKNVVWSTNSNRGETTRRQGGGVKANNGVVEPAEKAKVIFVEEEQLSSDGSAPTPRPSSVVSEA